MVVTNNRYLYLTQLGKVLIYIGGLFQSLVRQDFKLSCRMILFAEDTIFTVFTLNIGTAYILTILPDMRTSLSTVYITKTPLFKYTENFISKN